MSNSIVISIILGLISFVFGLYFGYYKFNDFHGPNSNIIRNLDYIDEEGNYFNIIPEKL